MVEHKGGAGQSLVVRISDWLSGYISFEDPRVALVLTLWAIHTWVSERFDATPYLSITAETKQAGKTRLLTLLSFLSRQGKTFADVTPAYLFTWMEQNNGRVSIFVDEAERLSSSALGVLRSLMNTGYLAGQTIGRKTPQGIQDFPVYCPKAFACIGDVNDTLKDRSIVVTLRRGKPGRDLRRAVALGEAQMFVEEIRRAFVNGWPAPADIPWMLGERDREIWAAIFGVAEALRLDDATMDALKRVAGKMVGAKTAPKRRYEREESEGEAVDVTYGDRALADLAAVMVVNLKVSGDKNMGSTAAVAAMVAIAGSPWEGYKGKGLDPISLSALVSRFGVKPDAVQTGKGRKGRKMVMGYKLADVQAVLDRTTKF